MIEHRSFENPSNRELMSDAPGISHSSMGPGRSAYDEADPHQENEDRFAAGAAKALGQAAKQNAGVRIPTMARMYSDLMPRSVPI